ncbi:MAG: adenosylmethionine--8-amino-7-oxononanoate transaminase [Prochlorococcus sp. SP3034]|nr:adenosylmethionine--8-amino-7-oxononanoate transaminase [Prochlorococcus sp. SP3034]|tara:strand:- start:3869 stop:5176 length:1308 start_codon:yes stop_codon:yes gene_type:complete
MNKQLEGINYNDWHPNIWPPFTQIKTSKPQIEVTHGKDSLIYTKNPERTLIDGISSWWVTLHGHGNEYIAEAIAKQAKDLEQIIFADFLHPQAKLLSERLSRITKLERLFFSDNGSSAVEVALKIAYQWWQNNGELRDQIIAFEGAYHGDTFGAMALGERNIFNESFQNLMFPVKRVPWPSTWIGDDEVEAKESNAIKKLIELLRKPTAAVIMEPLLQGAGGMNMVRPEFIKKVSRIIKTNNSLLIADEVLTGFGRCGKLFAFQRANIEPDLIAISKGLTGGFLPMGITLAKEKIFQSFISESPKKTFWHGHSFTANPLGCAAANASLDLLENNPSKYSNFESKHYSLLKKFKSLSFVKNIRVCGTIVAFEVDIDKNSGYLNSIGKTIKKNAIDKGLFIRPLGNVVYLLPPLSISDYQLEKSYDIIFEILTNLKN